jgi:hypothetical protein
MRENYGSMTDIFHAILTLTARISLHPMAEEWPKDVEELGEQTPGIYPTHFFTYITYIRMNGICALRSKLSNLVIDLDL